MNLIQQIEAEEIAKAARDNSDMMIAFASIDPHKGKMGAREAERLIKEEGIKGFKFHPRFRAITPTTKWLGPFTRSSTSTNCPPFFTQGTAALVLACDAVAVCAWPTATPCTWTMWPLIFPTCKL